MLTKPGMYYALQLSQSFFLVGQAYSLLFKGIDTKIIPILDFTSSNLIDKLPVIALLAWSDVCTCTWGWAGNAALCPLLSSNVCCNGSYNHHQTSKEKYSSPSAWSVFFSRQKGMIVMNYLKKKKKNVKRVRSTNKIQLRKSLNQPPRSGVDQGAIQ